MATEPKAGRKKTRLLQLELKAAPSSRVDSNSIAAVPLLIKAVAGQTGDLMQLQDSSGNVLGKITAAGQLVMSAGAALAASFGLSGQIGMARALYSFAVDGGAVGAITPATTAVIPANAIVFGGFLNPTTALTSGGSATIAVGTTAGSSATAIKAATAVASYTIDAIMATVPVFTAASAFKMSAAGSINITVATAALTAGIMEITLFYFVAAAA